jgi:lipoprotein-anchoring transpeptidase ErfK/SrfK
MLMMMSMLAALVALASIQEPASPTPPQAPPANAQIVPAPAVQPAAIPEGLAIQVMLDRAGFSPGAIDGTIGRNTRRALEAYNRQHGDQGAPTIEAVTRYRITPEDAAGPFNATIPSDLVEQSKLPSLGYRSLLELLAERFHTTPALLERLNPGVTFVEGDEIVVPNVEPLTLPTPAPATAANGNPEGRTTQPTPTPEGTSGKDAAAEITSRPDVVVTVSKGAAALSVKDAGGRLLMYAPVTTGSEHDPLPIGEWKVNGVQINPPFRYNPDLFWNADPSHTKAMIPPGPNNPVGVVWVDLSKEHYGIHGTPEPSAIGRSESHGCVRLTNWDALKLAGLVKPGTKVIFTR